MIFSHLVLIIIIITIMIIITIITIIIGITAQVQKKVLLGMARILRKVLEI